MNTWTCPDCRTTWDTAPCPICTAPPVAPGRPPDTLDRAMWGVLGHEAEPVPAEYGPPVNAPLALLGSPDHHPVSPAGRVSTAAQDLLRQARAAWPAATPTHDIGWVHAVIHGDLARAFRSRAEPDRAAAARELAILALTSLRHIDDLGEDADHWIAVALQAMAQHPQNPHRERP